MDDCVQDNTDSQSRQREHNRHRKPIWPRNLYFVIYLWQRETAEIYRLDPTTWKNKYPRPGVMLWDSCVSKFTIRSWRCCFSMPYFYTILRDVSTLKHYVAKYLVHNVDSRIVQSCLAGASSILPTMASIFAMTSGVNLSSTCSALTFSTICWGFDAPVITDETCSFLRHQASANCDCVIPSCSAMG